MIHSSAKTLTKCILAGIYLNIGRFTYYLPFNVHLCERRYTMRFVKRMKKINFVFISLLSVLFVASFLLNAHAQDKTQQIETGKELFAETNCLMCHLLNGEGGGLEDAPDFAGVSSRRDQASLREWLKTHLFEEPRIDMFEDDPTDANIESLVQYLSTL